jgi:hypothetical protein
MKEHAVRLGREETTVVDASALPKRFLLLPTEGRALRVMVAARCLGYVWTEEERWMARGSQGALLDTGSGSTVTEAVRAVFAGQSEPVLLRAQ